MFRDLLRSMYFRLRPSLVAALVNLAEVVRDLERGVALAGVDPLRWWCWSPWQETVLADISKLRLIRAANQIGKTVCVCADIIHEIRGTNPFRARRHRGPINIVLISESIEQMSQPGAVLDKLWSMLPKDEIDPRVSFVRGRGLRGVKIPAITFVSGPGADSVISLRTYKQDPATLAGATVHAVYCDEPAPEAAFAELMPRLLRHDGAMTISFTPVPGMPDQGWLREMVEDGVIHEHYATLTVENCTPRGYAAPFLSQRQIDEFTAAIPESHRPMRILAAWEPVVVDRWLSAFGDHAVKSFEWADIAAFDRDAMVIVGIDHGLVVGKQRAVLVAVGAAKTDAPHLWFIAECGADEISTPEIDAGNILAMLATPGVGIGYPDVDEWIGDRSTGDGRQLKSKSNGELRIQLQHQAGIASRDPRAKLIHTPQKGSGSVWYGLSLIQRALQHGRCLVHPRCTNLIDAMRKFKGDSRDPTKDVLDAARYAVERAIKRNQIIPTTGRVGHRPSTPGRPQGSIRK